MKFRVLNWSKPVVGVLLCAAAAMLAALFASPHRWGVFFPAAFVSVIVLLSLRYGVAVSIFGSLAAALVFAYFSPPVGSFRIASSVERENLAWMLLGSIVISYLLAPAASDRARHREDGGAGDGPPHRVR